MSIYSSSTPTLGLRSVCIKVFEQYVTVTSLCQAICQISAEFGRQKHQLSTNHVCLVNEINNLYRMATKKTLPKASSIATIKSESPKLELLLTIALGSYHGPYVQAFNRLRMALGQLIESFSGLLKSVETHSNYAYIDQTPSQSNDVCEAEISECQRLLERIRESTEALVFIRRLAVSRGRPDLPMNEGETVPEDIKLVLTACNVLHKATEELVMRDEYNSDIVGRMANLSLERNSCDGATATISFGRQDSRRSTLRLSFHLNRSLQTYGSRFLDKAFRYIPQSSKNDHLLSPDIVILGACDSGSILPCDFGFLNKYLERKKDIPEDIFLDRESVAVYVVDNNNNKYTNTSSVVNGQYGAYRDTCNCKKCFQKPRKAISSQKEGQLSSSSSSSLTKRTTPVTESRAGIILTRDTRETRHETLDLYSLLGIYDSMRPQVGIMDQLLLAYSLSTLILDLHTTPWFKNDWSLDDVALCKPLDEDLPITNLSFNPPLLCFRSGLQQAMDDGPPSFRLKHDGPDGNDDANVTPFHNLGVALLEIAYLKPFSFLKKGTKASGSAAEKVLMWQNPLGLKYQHIVERCLRGNLGAGPNPTSDEIRISAYTHIVTALQNMIQYLSQ